MNKNNYITDLLLTIVSQLKLHDQFPTFLEVEEIRGQGELCVVQEQECIHMGSNGYLGLQFDPEVIAAAHDALDIFGLGSSGSRITAGTTKAHSKLENTIAKFQGKEAAIVFSTGYLGNLAMFQGFGKPTMKGMLDHIAPEESKRLMGNEGNMHIIFDRMIHRSMFNGIESTLSPLLGPIPDVSSFPNGNYKMLRRILSQSTRPGKVIVVDSVYSLHGRLTDLVKITELANEFGADVYVDEAHATGIYGENGRGLAEEQGVFDKIRFHYGTLSKAGGAEGGFFAGETYEVDAMRTTAPWIFNTSMAPCVAAGAEKAIHIMMTEPERRAILRKNADWFRNEVIDLGYDVLGSQTQIVPVCFYTKKAAQQATNFLLKHGVFAPCYWPPAVGPNEAMVRMNVMYPHTKDQLTYVLELLSQLKPLSDQARDEITKSKQFTVV